MAFDQAWSKLVPFMAFRLSLCFWASLAVFEGKLTFLLSANVLSATLALVWSSTMRCASCFTWSSEDLLMAI